MHHRSDRCTALLLALAASSCQSYEPAPVDLAAHAAAFAARTVSPPTEKGLDRAAARLVALVFHPELRQARLRAGVAKVEFDESGRLRDPVLQGYFERFLNDVADPWIYSGALAITVPLTLGYGHERDLRQSQWDEALAAARTAEAAVVDELDRAWMQWSAAVQRNLLLRDLVDRLRDLEAIAERLAAAGEIPRLEARAFTLQRLARSAELAAGEAEQEQRERTVRQVLGMPPAARLELVPSLVVPPRTALADHERLAAGPRLSVPLCRHQVAERTLALEVRRQWPDLQLTPGFNDEDGEPRATFGFQIPLPLWNRNQAAIAAARAQRELTAEALRTALERALQDLDRAERLLRQSRARLQLVERDLLPLCEQQLEDGRLLAERGQLNTLLLLDAVLALHDARAAALAAQVAETEAQIEWNSLFWPDADPPR